jgi:hypothetical protein
MRPHLIAAALLAAFAPTHAVAQGADTAQRTMLRFVDARSIPRDVAEHVLRIANAPGTMRATGDAGIATDSVVSGDVAILSGVLTVGGRVTGSIVAVNSAVLLRPGAVVEGAIVVICGKLDGRDGATVNGDIEVHQERVDFALGQGSVRGDDEDERWWRRHHGWRPRTWSDMHFISARTYNRVEGLPVYIGPSFGRDMRSARVSLDLFGIARSVGSFEQTSDNIGHNVKLEMRFGRGPGARLGGRVYDIVDPVESWHLSDPEVGLASFFLRRDYRDYFNRHGGTIFGGLFMGNSTDLTLSYSDESWTSRATKNPLTLLRNNNTWRSNPVLDDGQFHIVNAVLRYDTRNDSDDPWSGWYLTGNYEYGHGAISRYAPTSPGVRATTVGGGTNYDRLFLDLRRYNRLSPDGQLNMRLALGGWLSGDALPLQRRFSVGGPGTLPGYDFRRTGAGTDVFQCSTADAFGGTQFAAVDGAPAQCERVALAQVEYRGSIRFDPFGILGGERSRRRRGWGRGAEWVVFADAGRGWLVGPREGELRYPRDGVPSLGTFRTDVGGGLRLDNLGLYIAKAVSEHGAPLNFFVRLNPRF